MAWITRLVKVVGNMLADLFLGSYRRNSDYYDEQTPKQGGKKGYYAFIVLATLVTLSLVALMYNQKYW